MRLVTRSDFDGLICGILLKEAGIIDNWTFVHPKDLQDGLFEPGPDDVLANVPYVEGAKMWFDHHSSEAERLKETKHIEGESRPAPSAAEIIYEYYGGEEAFPKRYKRMIKAVNRVDSGQLTREEILNPEGWVLIGFLTDPRTGLGRFRDFRISNYNLMEKMINHLRNLPVEEILALPDLQERVVLYNEQTEKFKKMVKDNTEIYDNAIVTDLRNQDTIYAGNRFLKYSLYPEQNVSVWIVNGKIGNTAIHCGYSILNRTCDVDIGNLMLKHGGGGHKYVGTCQVENSKVENVLKDIVDNLKG